MIAYTLLNCIQTEIVVAMIRIVIEKITLFEVRQQQQQTANEMERTKKKRDPNRPSEDVFFSMFTSGLFFFHCILCVTILLPRARFFFVRRSFALTLATK